jgi:aldehyde:ferredoxin oxidoreductase
MSGSNVFGSQLFGYHGRYRRIDLATATARDIALAPEVLRQVIGGVGLGTWILLQESSGAYDALSPAAPLVFAFAPLAGTQLNTTAKAAVVSKSPLTGRLNDAMISSRFALTGKGTGADALVIVGACDRWSTLFIRPEGIEIRPTPEWRGLSAADLQTALHAQHGDDWCVVAGGPAAEQGVPYATLSHDGRHAGRGGTGAVLGSKRLKAIAVRGDVMPPTAQPEQVSVLRHALKQASLGPGTEKYRTTGTLGNLAVFNRLGILPTRNFQSNHDGAADGLSAERLFAEGKVVRTTCADCMIGCEKRVTTADGKSTRVEYENVYALGPLLDIWDMDTVVAASQRCDDVGLDTITFGATLAFAQECVQRGLLDAPALLRPAREFLIEAINLTASGEGYGALLGLGSRALSQRIGQGSAAFAPHVKGLELPGYHPGGLQTLGLGLAVGSRGADHNKSGAYDLDLSGTVDRFTLDTERIAEMVEIEDQAAVIDSLILCKFVRRAIGNLYADGARMYAAVTGFDVSADDLRGTARTLHNMKKLFNQRQGWSADEDVLPERFLRPSDGKNPSIDPTTFYAARSRYYRERGWDEAGCLPPERALPERLNLPH